jgi:hypothetical protein
MKKTFIIPLCINFKSFNFKLCFKAFGFMFKIFLMIWGEVCVVGGRKEDLKYSNAYVKT